jgi:D-alanine-D-alanine ligase
MRVAFLYNPSSEDPARAAEDDVPDRSPMVAALERLGHIVMPVACTLDLTTVQKTLALARPDVVFNRVESLGGSDAMMAAVTVLLDAMQLPYTGCSTAALVATANKIAVKERLAHAGLPTPGWIARDLRGNFEKRNTPSPREESNYILKSVFEHASFGIDDKSMISAADCEDVQQLACEREATTGRPYFAEEFIDGREFNLSLIGPGPDVLPPGEIDFSCFPTGKPRIVGYGAKWDANSFEFQHTPRRFEFPDSDEPLLRRLKSLAVACWREFNLCGYARIDFRCDAASKPWILEINSNPCLSPDAGFAAALEQAGVGYDEGLQRILDEALNPRSCSIVQPVSAALTIA